MRYWRPMGMISILRKGISQTPSYGAMSLPPPDDRPPFMLIQDGKVRQDVLGEAGHDLPWLQAQLARIGAPPGRIRYFTRFSWGIPCTYNARQNTAPGCFL